MGKIIKKYKFNFQKKTNKFILFRKKNYIKLRRNYPSQLDIHKNKNTFKKQLTRKNRIKTIIKVFKIDHRYIKKEENKYQLYKKTKFNLQIHDPYLAFYSNHRLLLTLNLIKKKKFKFKKI